MKKNHHRREGKGPVDILVVPEGCCEGVQQIGDPGSTHLCPLFMSRQEGSVASQEVIRRARARLDRTSQLCQPWPVCNRIGQDGKPPWKWVSLSCLLRKGSECLLYGSSSITMPSKDVRR